MSIRIDWEQRAPGAYSGGAAVSLGEAWSGAIEQIAAVREAALEANVPALLVVNDPCRATETRAALIALAKLGPRCALPAFDVVVACGTHRFEDRERRAFEEGTFAGVGLTLGRIAWHNAHDASALEPRGGALVHPLAARAPGAIAVGSVEPHYFAGATGAHKTLTIGVLSQRDIEENHKGALSPASDVLRLDDNPVHQGVARLYASIYAGRPVVALNEVLAGSSIAAAVAGDPIESLHALLPAARDVYMQSIDAPVDVLHLRVPPPLGRSFYQADKALKNNHLAVRDGGAIILDAPCPDGIGQGAFLGLLRRAATYAGACAEVERDGYRLGDHKAVKLRHLTDPAARGVRLAVVSSGLSKDDLAALDAQMAPSVDEAIALLTASMPGAPKSLRGLIVDDAGNVSVTARRA